MSGRLLSPVSAWPIDTATDSMKGKAPEDEWGLTPSHRRRRRRVWWVLFTGTLREGDRWMEGGFLGARRINTDLSSVLGPTESSLSCVIWQAWDVPKANKTLWLCCEGRESSRRSPELHKLTALIVTFRRNGQLCVLREGWPGSIGSEKAPLEGREWTLIHLWTLLKSQHRETCFPNKHGKTHTHTQDYFKLELVIQLFYVIL